MLKKKKNEEEVVEAVPPSNSLQVYGLMILIVLIVLVVWRLMTSPLIDSGTYSADFQSLGAPIDAQGNQESTAEDYAEQSAKAKGAYFTMTASCNAYGQQFNRTVFVVVGEEGQALGGGTHITMFSAAGEESLPTYNIGTLTVTADGIQFFIADYFVCDLTY